MKKIFVLFALLAVLTTSHAQKFQDPLLYGKKENRFLPLTLQGLPKDTFPIPTTPEDLRVYPWMSAKGDSIYLWSTNPSEYKWKLFSVSGGGAVTSLGTIGFSPNANGATIASSILTLQPADATYGGVVTALPQEFAGKKTILDTLIAANALYLTGLHTPVQITADRNDYDGDNSAVWKTTTAERLSSDASRNITGFASGADGRILVIHNVGSNNIVFKNENASSTAANRFAIGSDLTLSAGQSATFRYDGFDSRWRLIASGGGSGGGGGTQTLQQVFNTEPGGSWITKNDSINIPRNDTLHLGFRQYGFLQLKDDSSTNLGYIRSGIRKLTGGGNQDQVGLTIRSITGRYANINFGVGSDTLYDGDGNPKQGFDFGYDNFGSSFSGGAHGYLDIRDSTVFVFEDAHSTRLRFSTKNSPLNPNGKSLFHFVNSIVKIGANNGDLATTKRSLENYSTTYLVDTVFSPKISADTTVNYIWMDGSGTYKKIGTVFGNYRGEMTQQGGIGVSRYINFQHHSVRVSGGDDFWNEQLFFDTLNKKYTWVSGDNSTSIGMETGVYTGLSFSPRPTWTTTGSTKLYLRNDLATVMLLSGKYGGVSTNLFAIDSFGTLYLYKAPPDGAIGDSVMVWNSIDKKAKKIAASSFVTSETDPLSIHLTGTSTLTGAVSISLSGNTFDIKKGVKKYFSIVPSSYRARMGDEDGDGFGAYLETHGLDKTIKGVISGTEIMNLTDVGGTIGSTNAYYTSDLSNNISTIGAAGTFAVDIALNGVTGDIGIHAQNGRLKINDGNLSGISDGYVWTTTNHTTGEGSWQAKQSLIQFKDEGTNIGSSGAITAVNFTGAGVTASHSSGTITVNIPGGGGGGLSDGDYGDVTVSSSSSVLTVDADINKSWTGTHAFGGGFAKTSYQTITSGSSSTVSNATTKVIFNPVSDLTAYTLTLPASPADGDEIEIIAGGTITGGNAVSTSFTLSPNSGQTINTAITPTQLYSGDVMLFTYKSSNTTWYRKQ